MSAIGPGDWVICIDGGEAGGGVWLPGEGISTGGLYQVSDCFEDALDNSPCVALVGRERHKSSAHFGFRVGFDLCRFRPAFEGDPPTLIAADAPAEPEGVNA